MRKEVRKINLKALRENSGYKQQDVASKLNITQGAVSQWELGLCHPEYKYLIKLADIYDCSIEQLIKAIQPANEITGLKK
jgi:transcriptional regulator with XRE-family HTH domain